MRALSLGEHPETGPRNLDNLMDLSTSYLGMKMRTPLVPSASPLSRNIDDVKRLEDAGAAAVVFHSVFEEQLRPGSEAGEFRVSPELYLDHIAQAKDNVSIPIIGSLNAATPGGWVHYARQIEQAGANALELNIYDIPTDMDCSGSEVEQVYIEILKAVKSEVAIPVAVKLSPFFSNMANMARRLDDAGADALVLFNRFCQPDIDLGKLDVALTPVLSVPKEMLLPLRWVGILHGRIKGLVNHKNCSNPSAFERAHYARALDSYDPLFLMAGKPHFS